MENIEDFYKRISYPLPTDLNNSIGHFNVFKRTCCVDIPYSRKNYFKITLLKGPNKIHYADKTLESEKYALMFSNPLVPYSWEALDGKKEGYFCIFTEEFFHQYGIIKNYPLFDIDHNKLFLLDDESLIEVEKIFEKMLEENSSEYDFKDDILRNLTLTLIHLAMKMQPAKKIENNPDKKTKIYSLFNELLNRQFPINLPYERLELKAPSDYAKSLNIHTNHLNRTLKEITSKTTSELIASRVLEEAKILLKHSTWNVNEISYSLGYEDSAHFINFFKKRISQTPNIYRTFQNV
ncbi:helix-turn-helix domain-containing protein [Aliarcobacter butzleri]|uniref:helix-turn-helix domain-containing protein n=1 Tax=Aliarcobacter butzleri TaxID=28197 RepID=UPI0012FA3BFE|nr:response regulator transcription factor [Aliarcobacter butzleri]MCG3673846.1 helix-turn-helix transcriptional regulator [Aliarcobacter butzleri]MCG3696453.1 helix-turn-helix transcriptional regulator [Aliarcobacter butzleri]MCG3698593.1 helix-turn-helix transcriptional regulator [Aliarcobacter butzleri]MCT7619024.1 helix-turn-helix transcriptional regulator [Aliarcobacter butzleri]MDN5079138.1 helix-turn-helix transcriptional regulator [Aliarcobacter butzleri]